jgi:hypothetical protein
MGRPADPEGHQRPRRREDALSVGADAIVVSNHGGRQLDGAHLVHRMLGPIVDAVGDKVEVHIDGGIRSGQDVFKAKALGAQGTYIGRAFIYGLGAMGRGRRHQGAADHPQGTRHHHGAVRPARCERPVARQPAAAGQVVVSSDALLVSASTSVLASAYALAILLNAKSCAAAGGSDVVGFQDVSVALPSLVIPRLDRGTQYPRP